MKTLNILTDSELKQLFGPLEDILPLHEGKDGDEGSTSCSATCLATGIEELTAAAAERSISSGKCIESDNCFRSWENNSARHTASRAETKRRASCVPSIYSCVYHRRVRPAPSTASEDGRSDRRRGQFIDGRSILDLLYRLKPKGDTSIDAIGQIYLEWVSYRRDDDRCDHVH